ncbi:MAG TPA: DUF1800 domain-containing protein [Saprospiraceae bacterium]|nr:DUF1800 domain-containing protein [Saprospiraceae bacterium]HMP23523.1 DUF1800 domain-containing protein [Saprospiraceae bacterium]
MIAPSNCIAGTLAPYTPATGAPWDKRRVTHLYRRLGFGAGFAEVNAALAQAPGALVDTLLNTAAALPTSPEPEWAYWDISRYANQEMAIEHIFQWRRRWVLEMLTNGVREKLALFWHNHFVTRLDSYFCPSWMYQYHKLLQQYALGNFRDFVYEIGKSPAMLVFLNGVQNTRFNPNENYARELYELFTLGRDNGYTQQDIVQTARALTGWNGITQQTLCGEIAFVPAFFDPGQKTIFGRTGNWGYDDVHRLLFEERGELVAQHICRKLYRAFVSPQVDEAIVAELADIFLTHDFELLPVLRVLFKSEHFFDDVHIGVLVKSPLETMLTLLREGNFQIPWGDTELDGLLYLSSELGQDLFNPIDVAGWQGDRTWVNSNTLTGRWQALRFILFTLFQNHPEQLRALAADLSNNSNDAEYITEVLVNHFFPNGMQLPEDYDRATMAFKAEIPNHYFEDGSWSLAWETAPVQTALLLDHLVRRPEFQLM